MAGLERGEVRLYEFPPSDKRRPVVVLTRQPSIRLLNSVTVAPITSSIRGVPAEVVLDERDGMKGPCAVNLHNLLTIPSRRLGPRVGSLSDQRMTEICGAIKYALGCASSTNGFK
jgi:mRNA interferase MazF